MLPSSRKPSSRASPALRAALPGCWKQPCSQASRARGLGTQGSPYSFVPDTCEPRLCQSPFSLSLSYLPNFCTDVCLPSNRFTLFVRLLFPPDMAWSSPSHLSLPLPPRALFVPPSVCLRSNLVTSWNVLFFLLCSGFCQLPQKPRHLEHMQRKDAGGGG